MHGGEPFTDGFIEKNAAQFCDCGAEDGAGGGGIAHDSDPVTDEGVGRDVDEELLFGGGCGDFDWLAGFGGVSGGVEGGSSAMEGEGGGEEGHDV